MIVDRFRALKLASAAVALATVVLASGTLGASAETSLGGFLATADADGGRAFVSLPGFIVVEQFVDAGGPVSQAVLDSQSGKSYASLPYPGGTVVAYQGLAALAGVQSPIPYPTYVSADYPASESQKLDGGPAYALSANASATSADAEAYAGEPDTTGSSTTTSAIVEGEKLTVEAVSVNRGVTLPDGVLKIASIRSRSVTTYAAGDPRPVSKTELLVDGLTVGGLTFSYDADGLHLAGTGVPIGGRATTDLLADALGPTGYQVRFVESSPLNGGASAGLVEISGSQAFTAPLPPNATFTMRFGGAATSVALGSALSGEAPPSQETSLPQPWTAAPTTDVAELSLTAAPVAASPVAGPDRATGRGAVPGALELSIEPVALRINFFYGVLVVGAVLLVAGAAGWVFKGGVRT